MQTPDFSIVTPEWIEERRKQKKLTKRKLAALINTDETLLGQWLSGYRNPSGAAIAALYYVLNQN